MRGKPQTSPNPWSINRITPADAGKTPDGIQFRTVDEDHPRGCGENRQARQCGLHSLGSPPRMRGKLNGVRRYARFVVDHPRGCGENDTEQSISEMNEGSPPRMRGKLSSCGFRVPKLGITPADAGKTRPPTVARDSLRDHPRGCGENRVPLAEIDIQGGSPPRMRGKHYSIYCCIRQARITPADAGKTIEAMSKCDAV